jgi:hypothetical protein
LGITDPEKIKDVEARIGFRSMKVKGNLVVLDLINNTFMMLASRLKLLKSLRGLNVREALKIAKDANRVSERFGNAEIYIRSYKEDVLELIAENFLEKFVVHYINESKQEGLCMGLALVQKSALSEPGVQEKVQVMIPLSQKSTEIQKVLTDHLEKLLKEEMGPDKWKKIMEMPVGRKLMRSGSMKSWPIVRNTIYNLYATMLPLYPSRAHIYGFNKKWQGEKAKYPQALLRDLIQLFQERFPKDFKDLIEKDVISCVQYRKKKYLV